MSVFHSVDFRKKGENRFSSSLGRTTTSKSFTHNQVLFRALPVSRRSIDAEKKLRALQRARPRQDSQQLPRVWLMTLKSMPKLQRSFPISILTSMPIGVYAFHAQASYECKLHATLHLFAAASCTLAAFTVLASNPRFIHYCKYQQMCLMLIYVLLHSPKMQPNAPMLLTNISAFRVFKCCVMNNDEFSE